MQTLIFLLLTFLIVVFAIMQYFKSKTHRKESLNKGICPSCGAEPVVFEDKVKGTTFVNNPITSRVLKNHGCSGVIEIEYKCKQCGLKEVHSNQSGGCSL